jgi:malonyl-CoA O-methyltransferase
LISVAKSWLRRILRPVRTLPSRAAYALWAEQYPPTAHNALMKLEQAAMFDLLPDPAGKTALDLACGSGRYGLILRERGAQTVIGLDNSPEMLRQSATMNGSAPRALSEMDAIPLATASVDLIICGLALGHLPAERMRRTIAECARALRPGGVLLFSDFHPYAYLSGGRRIFTDGRGKQYAVEHHPHLIADYFAVMNAAMLRVDAIREVAGAGMTVPGVLVMRGKKQA